MTKRNREDVLRAAARMPTPFDSDQLADFVDLDTVEIADIIVDLAYIGAVVLDDNDEDVIEVKPITARTLAAL